MYLLDTNVVSELRRMRRDSLVVEWAATHPLNLCYLSVLTLGEIRRGIAKQTNINPVFAHTLHEWLIDIERRYDTRILDITPEVAKAWGDISYAVGDDHNMDLLIAATAQVYGLTVVTRNTKDFAGAGIKTLNPFVKHT